VIIRNGTLDCYLARIGQEIRQTAYFWLAYEGVTENTRGADTSV